MAYAAKLCNPTPWQVDLPYEKGIVLRVPAYGDVELTRQQMDDYSPDKPGSEAVLEETDYFGVFLLDADRPYDEQALEALKKSARKKEQRFNEVVQTHRDRAARQNITIDESTFDNLLKQMGMDQIKTEIETLKGHITKLQTIVDEAGPNRRAQLDPARTVFALQPPREFPSVASREFFLEQNQEIAAKEKEYREALEQAEQENQAGVQ